MDGRQMQLSFEMKAGQFSDYQYPMPFQSHEIQDYLNEAQEALTILYYGEFEKTEQLRTEISPLIRNEVFSSFVTGSAVYHTNAHVVDIPVGVLFPIEERCNVSYTDCNDASQSKQVKVLPITHDEYSMNVSNPYLKPSVDLIWRMDHGDAGSGYKQHELITDGVVTLNTYNLRYIKRPLEINLITVNTCELDPSVHEHIVDLAIEIALRTRTHLKRVDKEVNQNQES